jgi:hypothetical protein
MILARRPLLGVRLSSGLLTTDFNCFLDDRLELRARS